MFFLSFFKGDTEGKTFPVPWKSNGNDKELKYSFRIIYRYFNCVNNIRG